MLGFVQDGYGRAHATGVPTNNKGVTFYLFMPDQRDMIPFCSSQN